MVYGLSTVFFVALPQEAMRSFKNQSNGVKNKIKGSKGAEAVEDKNEVGGQGKEGNRDVGV